MNYVDEQQVRAKNVSSTTKRLSKESTPMRSISTTSIVSQSTDLRDFISGSVVITTIADLYQQTKSGDFYVPAMITGIESSGEWYYIDVKQKDENVDVPTELETLIGKAMVFKGDINNITSLDMTVDVFILNPFTMEIKALPSIKVPNKPPNKPPIEADLRMAFGFGLSNNMAGKVIMILRFEHVKWDCDDCYEIVMVCSQVDNSWNWRQIDVVTQGSKYSLFSSGMTHDFYLKGKYYWEGARELVWFDMDNEVFGKVKLPSGLNSNFVAVVNETIVAVSSPHPNCDDELDGNYIDIWLTDENNNVFNCHKQARTPDDICWMPIGIWNPSGHLLLFSSYMDSRYDELVVNDDDMPFFNDGFKMDLFSIDMVTQEKKIICTSQEKKSAINIVLNPSGYVQVCKDVIKAQDWNGSNIFWHYGAYARVFNESLKML
nr:putative F-box protein At1g19160 [Ipomoea batatas]